jgi:nucleoside-diphosphate-sugar epimerase
MRAQPCGQAIAALQARGATVLVAGATGGVGQLVVAKLAERGFKVRALTRDAAKARRLFGESSDVIPVEMDLRDEAQVNTSGLFDGCLALVACLGTTAFPSSRCLSASHHVSLQLPFATHNLLAWSRCVRRCR